MTHVSLYLSTAGASFEDTCDHVQLAERSRFRAVWFMDSAAQWAGAPADLARLEPWSLISAVATYTNRISLGTLATPPGRRHPVIAARQIATADRISDARVEVAVSAGDETDLRDTAAQGELQTGARLAQMVEEVAVIRSLWRNDRTTYNGEHFVLEDEVCEPKPEFPIPVWMQVAWGRPRMARAIARHADGYVVAVHAAAEELVRTQIDCIRQACIAVGRNPSELRSSRIVGVTLTDVEVDPAEAKRHLLATADPSTRRKLEESGPARTEFLNRFWPDLAPTEYRFDDHFEFNEFHCIGTPRQVADQILAGTRDLGIDEAVIWPNGRLHGWDPDRVKTQGDLIERIAKELVPLLRRAR